MKASRACALALLFLGLCCAVRDAGAKRGCSAFGHSCYGGHGKRSGDTALNMNDSPLLNSLRRQQGQEEVPQHTLYPGYKVLQEGDDIIPVRDGGIYNHEDNDVITDLIKYRLRNIVQHWINNYRRDQLSPEDPRFPDNTV